MTDDLVQRLARGDHPVEIRDGTTKLLEESIGRNYVLVLFTETGTELGFELDPEHTDVSQADFAESSGSVHLAGELVLNYVRVRCIADIDVPTLKGTGRLEILEQDS